MSEQRTVIPRITRYTIGNDDNPVTVEEVIGIGPGGVDIRRWAIRRGSGAWTRERVGFCHEPIPSERDEDYYASARWASADDALQEVAEHVAPWADMQRRGS